MRPEDENPLDLNNLPGDDDYSGAPAEELGRKKKSGRENEESEKVYECRFCSLKFTKSQALGGHMNRHRQERETETLNRARQLVFSNDNLISPTPPHHILGGQLPISHGGYHHHYQTSDPLRAAGYPPARYYCGSSSSANLPPPESCMYPSPPPLVPYPPSHYNINPLINDYFVGHAVLSTAQLPSCTTREVAAADPPVNNHTCIGAPVGRGFMQGSGDNNKNNNSTTNNSSNNNNNNEDGEEENS